MRRTGIFADNYSRFYSSTTRTCFTFHVATIANRMNAVTITTINFRNSNDKHSRSRYKIRIHSGHNRISPKELLKTMRNYDCRKLKRPRILRSKSRNYKIISTRSYFIYPSATTSKRAKARFQN